MMPPFKVITVKDRSPTQQRLTKLRFTSQVRARSNPFDLSSHHPPSESLMNVSGPSVQNVLRKTSHTPQSLVLIHDSLGHKVEAVSGRLGGSANGHNGVKSVISALGTPDFHRLRIGIGRNEGVDAAEYVLQKLSNHERTFWSPSGKGLDAVLKNIERITLG